jgi:hypothetical protein
LKGESGKADGFKVAVLDYCAPTDTAAIAAQLREVTALNWADYISSSSLGEIRYDVFHRHSVDINPPTWNSSIGAAGAFSGDRSVRLLWNRVTDQSQPVSFNVYYTAGVPFTMAAATLLQNVPAVPDTDSGTWMYMVTNLPNFTRYSFVVRAKDALGHEDQNLTVVQATPPDTSSMNMVIDGDFSDWTNVPSLNRPPNPVEQSGDAPADADITNLWAASSGSNLYLSYSVAGNVNYSSYFYHVFLDVDENAVTGFRYQDSASVGAEYMVENGGLWRYTGSGGSNWSWVPASGMALATSGGRVELSIPLTMLIAAQPVNPGVRIMLEANLAAAPYSLVDVAPSSFADSSYRFVVVTLGVRQTADALPQQIELYQNYPNPFNSTTVISIQLPALRPERRRGIEGSVVSRIKIVVYDLLGREVATLVNESKQPGGYSVRFDAGNLASGVYCCRLTAGRASITRSMIVLK